ncbi:hypothetical protein CI610_00805 [invertebrate metagenome]|uniref:Uncharacterized protein n=1 Tax=invertebrate metagenome TaxID=1711999 RepID=A0A2H9TAD6_9ZZZZ
MVLCQGIYRCRMRKLFWLVDEIKTKAKAKTIRRTSVIVV